MVSAEMASGNEGGALERLKETTVGTTRLKASIEALVLLFMQNVVMPYLPLSFVKQIATDGFNRHSMVFTNVPGPGTQGRMLGKKIEEIMILFPNILPQVSVLSYAGKLSSSMLVDPETMKDPQSLMRHFEEELNELSEALNVPSPLVKAKKNAGNK